MGVLSPYGVKNCNTNRGFHQSVKVGQYPRVKNEEPQALRRRALQRVINDDYDGNVSAFARRVKKQQSQIADMLAGRKSFGEKVARAIESSALLIPGILDRDPDNPNRQLDQVMIFGAPITAEAAQIGREWAKLNEPIRTQVAELITTLVSTQTGQGRRPPAARRRASPHSS